MNLCKWCKYARSRFSYHTRCKGNIVPPEILGNTPTRCECACNKGERKEVIDYRYPSFDWE